MNVQKVAFIMYPLANVKAHKDTSYHMMLAAAQQGHRVFHLGQEDLSIKDFRVWANVTEVKVHEDVAQPYTVVDQKHMEMAELDAIFIRTDPPFDRAYFYTTLLLDMLPPTTKVFNRPEGLRNWNEKLSALNFPGLTPKTLISRRAEDIVAFMHEIGRITLKPVDGHGGRGIVFLKPNSENLDQLIEMVTHGGQHLVVAQQYVPEASKGDKRILMLNGEPLGGVLRVHEEGKEINNLDAGGTANPTELTERDLEICAGIKDGLVSQGIHFAGIDILGDYLIEINVTSPTGLQELCRFSGKAHNHTIIETLLQG